MPSFKMLKILEPDAARKRRGNPVILTDKGRPLMVLVPVDAAADVESISLSMSPEFEALLARSRALYKPGSGIPLDQVRRQFRVSSAGGEESRIGAQLARRYPGRT